MKSILKDIHSPVDLRKIPIEKLPILAQEIRDFILDVIAVKQGHLASSLGVVELSIALHYIFNTPDDLLIWDVGHQAYAHKILTGRKEKFHTNRQWDGISGFPSCGESIYDCFGTGHSSTSISAALGMATASWLNGEKLRKHIVVIGDASIASGMAFEGLNNSSIIPVNLLIILNDNCMSIDNPVGGFETYLQKLRDSKVKETFFKSLSINFLGSFDGHDFKQLFQILNRAKNIHGVQVLHLKTIKGKGLKQAENDKIRYHSPDKFDRITGEIFLSKEPKPEKYQEVFGKTLVELAQKNPKIVGITPAMLTGSSLNLLQDKFPNRTFDVGISEQHAVTFSAGLATQGYIAYCVIYSTFLQRAYDQIIHDVALQKLPVIFCIDRAGLVGQDGATHQGVFDIAFLRPIPNMVILAPSNEIELRNMLYTAQLPDWKYPTAIRYPRGRGSLFNWQKSFHKIEFGEVNLIKKGKKIAILSVGPIMKQVQEALKICKNPDDFSHYDMRFIKPLNEYFLDKVFMEYQQIVTVEEGVIKGGFGSSILEFASQRRYYNFIHLIGIPDVFIAHGEITQQENFAQIDVKSIALRLDEINKK